MRKIVIVCVLLAIFVGCMGNRDDEELESLIEQSRQISKGGQYKEARIYLEENIKEKERNADYYLYHGLYLEFESPLYNLQKYNADYLKAYELAPDDYRILLALGQSYNLLDDWENAIIYLEKAAALYPEVHPNNPDPYGSLSNAYYLLNEFEKALEANEKALEADPDKAWNYLDKGLILSHLEGLEPLIHYYEKAVSMEPENINLPKYYGNRLIEMGEDELARELFRKFLAIDEDYYWAYADLGYIRMANGDWEEGKEYLDKSLSMINNDPFTLMYLAFYHYFQGDLPKAFDFYLDFRLSMERNVIIYKPKSKKEFEEYFADDRLFQRLMESVQPVQ